MLSQGNFVSRVVRGHDQSLAIAWQATDGNFYGGTGDGGAHGGGTIFQITPAGELTTLFSFDGSDAHGVGPMVQYTDGTLYGLTSGSASPDGSIFSLSLGLGPFVETVPVIGTVRTKVTILGTNLANATAVSFNGIPAKFKIVSNSEITAKVPVGATTGPVTVSTPIGTLNNNQVFLDVP